MKINFTLRRPEGEGRGNIANLRQLRVVDRHGYSSVRVLFKMIQAADIQRKKLLYAATYFGFNQIFTKSNRFCGFLANCSPKRLIPANICFENYTNVGLWEF